jgi:hypothetical protein
MKTFLQFSALTAALAACLAMTPDDMPTPAPYEPTDNPAQRVREYIRWEQDTLDESDLHSPNVPDSLHRAALDLTR